MTETFSNIRPSTEERSKLAAKLLATGTRSKNIAKAMGLKHTGSVSRLLKIAVSKGHAKEISGEVTKGLIRDLNVQQENEDLGKTALRILKIQSVALEKQVIASPDKVSSGDVKMARDLLKISGCSGEQMQSGAKLEVSVQETIANDTILGVSELEEATENIMETLESKGLSIDLLEDFVDEVQRAGREGRSEAFETLHGPSVDEPSESNEETQGSF